MVIETALQFVQQNPVLVTRYALEVIGGATILFRTIAASTENQVDNKIVNFLRAFLERVSLNKKDGSVEIDIKSKE